MLSISYVGFDGFLRNLEKTEQEIDLIRRKTLIDFFSRIIQKTPRDEGTAVANWQISFGSPKQNILKGKKTHASKIKQITAKINDAKSLNTIVYLSNNLPYIDVLEYGLYPELPFSITGKTTKGYSTQAPEGMVRVTLAEFSDLLLETQEALDRLDNEL